MTALPNQNQLVLPLLQTLAEAGGSATTPEICARVADRIGATLEERSRRVDAGVAGKILALNRDIRWSQQRAKALGLVQPIREGSWSLTGKGRNTLRTAAPGVVITVFQTNKGFALLASAEDAVGYIDDGSVQLVLTSPPYPLIRQKTYGNLPARQYVDWMLRSAENWRRIVTDQGSILLNIGDVWQAGQPTLDLYQERLLIELVDKLGLHLCQRFAWHSPSKMPAPAEWVTRTRVRVTNRLEQIYWLSPSPHPKANNRNVLKPYSRSMQDRLRAGGEKAASRPSGYQLAEAAFSADNGGSIPDNLISAANSASNDRYTRLCKERGITRHPARFPIEIPKFFIKFLTEPGDVIYDPYGGSGTSGEAAEQCNRNWILSERALDYLEGASIRFETYPGYRSYL